MSLPIFTSILNDLPRYNALMSAVPFCPDPGSVLFF